MELSAAEKETHLNMTADDRETWHVFTDDPYWIRRLDEVGELVKVVGQGKEYRLNANQVRIGKAIKRNLTDEQREALATRMRQNQARYQEKEGKQAVLEA